MLTEPNTRMSVAMAFNPLFSEYADFCPVCDEMTMMCWIDSDLAASICDDCAGCLVQAEHMLSQANLDPPSLDLINRNP